MTLTAERLVAATGCNVRGADILAPMLERAMAVFDMDSPLRQAHFLAQTAYESALYTQVSENLNYSAQRLAAVFPRYVFLPPADPRGRADASLLAGHPDQIANVVYANRLGNGPRESGDGWKYRGRGYIQLTGKDNYAALNRDVPQIPAVTLPDAITSAEYAALSAAWFWATQGCNAAADSNNVAIVSSKVNGGDPKNPSTTINGFPARIAATKRAMTAFGLG